MRGGGPRVGHERKLNAGGAAGSGLHGRALPGPNHVARRALHVARATAMDPHWDVQVSPREWYDLQDCGARSRVLWAIADRKAQLLLRGRAEHVDIAHPG